LICIILKNIGPKNKYKKDAHVFEKAEVINPSDSQEEEIDEKIKNKKENKYSNMDHVNKSKH